MRKGHRDKGTKGRRGLKDLARASLLLVLLPATAWGDELIRREVSRLKLRPQVNVCGAAVTLADVLTFTEADPRLGAEIGHQPVNPDLQPPARTVFTHDRIVERLGELGVNLSRVLVGGALSCRVTLEPAPAQTGIEAAPAWVGAHSRYTALLTRLPATDEGNTLADALRNYVNAELASLGGTAEIEFERAGREFLTLTRPPWEFIIRSSSGGDKLGLREFEVVIRRDGRTQRTARLAARVRLVKNVLVARKPLGIGTFVRQEDVAFEPRMLERRQDVGLDEVGQIIGQQVKRYIPVGEMIGRGDIKAVDLVKRSRPVSVNSAGDGVSVRLTGMALDSGGYGDTVRVRIGESRKDLRILRGVVTGVGSVSLIGGGV
jgi:flagella basal body P-ring formation protein FlgA